MNVIQIQFKVRSMHCLLSEAFCSCFFMNQVSASSFSHIFFVLMYGKVIKSWRGLKSKGRKTLQGIHTFDGSVMLHASFDPCSKHMQLLYKSIILIMGVWRVDLNLKKVFKYLLYGVHNCILNGHLLFRQIICTLNAYFHLRKNTFSKAPFSVYPSFQNVNQCPRGVRVLFFCVFIVSHGDRPTKYQ